MSGDFTQQADMLRRVATILAWMALPVLTGFGIWHIVLRRLKKGAAIASATGRTLSEVVLLCVSPALMIVLFWSAATPLGRALALPVAGLFAHLFGGLAGWSAAKAGGLDRTGRGAFFLCGLSSNILSFGSIVTLFLLGPIHAGGPDGAVAEMAMYRVFETPIYFLFAWPVFATFAPSPAGVSNRWWSAFRRAFRPVTMAPIAGMIVGAALKEAGVPFPAALDGWATPLVKLNTLMIGLIVGLTLRAASPRKYLGSCLVIAGIKFLLVPAATVTLAWLLGCRGHSLIVVMICSSMPLANFAVIGAAYYGLAEDRIAAVWLFTTGMMLIVVPVLAVIMAFMG